MSWEGDRTKEEHVADKRAMNLHFQVVWNGAPLWGRQDQADKKLPAKGQSALHMIKCPPVTSPSMENHHGGLIKLDYKDREQKFRVL